MLEQPEKKGSAMMRVFIRIGLVRHSLIPKKSLIANGYEQTIEEITLIKVLLTKLTYSILGTKVKTLGYLPRNNLMPSRIPVAII